jgi:hypothetical protein
MGRMKWRMEEISIAVVRRGRGWLCIVERREKKAFEEYWWLTMGHDAGRGRSMHGESLSCRYLAAMQLTTRSSVAAIMNLKGERSAL